MLRTRERELRARCLQTVQVGLLGTGPPLSALSSGVLDMRENIHLGLQASISPQPAQRAQPFQVQTL